MSELRDLTPIKVVDNMKNLCALQRQVILGDGVSSAVVAIPHVNSKKHPAKKVWRVLLDSGSEGGTFSDYGKDETTTKICKIATL